MAAAGAIAAQSDLVALVRAAGGTLRRQGAVWRGPCVLHGGDNPTAFVVYQKGGKQLWKCFSGSCGQGDAIDFVMALDGVDWLEACRRLSGDYRADPAVLERRQAERLAQLEQQAQAMLATIAQMRREQVWVRYWQNLQTSDHARALWRARGVPDDWQGFFQLGYAPDHTVWASGREHHTATLTIPIFEPGWQFINLKHRLLAPPTARDRYRIHHPGVPAGFYVADPDRDLTGPVLVVEGEIKAMVTFLTLDDPATQVVGLMGKSAWRETLDRFAAAEPIYLLPDPDGEAAARQLADSLGTGRCRLIGPLPMKVDDAVTAGFLDKMGLRRLVRGAARMN